MWFRGLVAISLIGFLFQTVVVLSRFGYLGFFETATSNAVVLQFFVDLIICLSLVALWIYRDARKLGVSPWPFILSGGLFGVAGPLAYLLRRPRVAKNGGATEFAIPPLIAGAILALFTAFTLLVLARHGYVTFAFYAGANEATELLFIDLALSTLFVTVLLVRDARARGGSFLPFLPLAFLFGAISPLLYLTTRRFHRRIQRLVGTGAIPLAAFAMTLGAGHADLRNEAVRRSDPESEHRGSERLERLAERHGLSAFRRHVTMETVSRDRWPSGAAWWPENEQRFRAQALLGTFTSRVELLDGPAEGELWGLQAWAPYKKKGAGASPTFIEEDDGALTFYLPTLQYFNELPFRLLNATVVRDGGTAGHRGRRYDLVFVTWGRPEPQPDLDQYVLWIDRETGLLAKARYTVREAVPRMPPSQQRLFRPLVAGTIHFEDYREIEGVQVPFTQTITLPPPELTRYPLSEHFFHRLTIEEAAFDTVSREDLLPDPSRGEPGDRKPAE
ncbi:MAG TPA: hypothetical protein VLK65_09260 [Vicinamibacteria bacterium]|nr:hypothetical protein [Vicinamibacteria bacterium]